MSKDFTQQIQDALMEYGSGVTDAVAEATKQVCEESRKKLRSTSPKGRTGKYARGWQYKVTQERGWTHGIVFNGGAHASLTHLLEKGHALRNGRRAAALVHIAPVEEATVDDYEEYVTSKIEELKV